MIVKDGMYEVETGGMFFAPRLKLLGILYAGPQHSVIGKVEVVDVPVVDRAVAFSRIPNNLGRVVKATQLKAFDDLLRATVPC